MNYNIAIDGPAGAGKSTIAKMVAKKLGMIYIDTGAMYRAIGLFFSEKKINPEDGASVKELLPSIEIDLMYEGSNQQLILNGENVNHKIRTAKAGMIASKFAVIPEVRSKLVDVQRKLAKKTPVVMDGRDIGTFVLPDAVVKIYLTADTGVRAKRRLDELIEKGEKLSLTELEKEIKRRDENDMNREVSPLRQAEDSILVDSSYLSIEETVAKIIEIACSRNPIFRDWEVD